MNFARAVKELRQKLGVSQADLAARDPDGKLTRLDVLHVEKGKKSNSWEVRKGLARAFRLTLNDLDAYVEGNIDVRQVLMARYPDPVRPPAPLEPTSIALKLLPTANRTRAQVWLDWKSAETEACTDADIKRRRHGPKNNRNMWAAVLAIGAEETAEPQPRDFGKAWIAAKASAYLDIHDRFHRPPNWRALLKESYEQWGQIRGPKSSGRSRIADKRAGSTRASAKTRSDA